MSEQRGDADREMARLQSEARRGMSAGYDAGLKALAEGGREPAESDAPGIGPAKALLYTVTGYLNETYPHWQTRWGALPDGLRLEMHPRVHYTLAADSDTYFWPREPGDSFEELYRRTFRLPVKITPDLPESTWRLVVVTEDVKLGGKL
jgi:hypothetical protein